MWKLGCNYRYFTKLNLCNEVLMVFLTWAGALLKALKRICLQHETKTRDWAALIWQSMPCHWFLDFLHTAGKTLFRMLAVTISMNSGLFPCNGISSRVFYEYQRHRASANVCGQNWDVAKSYACTIMEFGSKCQTITRKRFGDIWSTAIRVVNSVVFWKIGNVHPILNQY